MFSVDAFKRHAYALVQARCNVVHEVQRCEISICDKLIIHCTLLPIDTPDDRAWAASAETREVRGIQHRGQAFCLLEAGICVEQR